MAEKSTFGIDQKALEKLNFKGAVERIQNDLKTDFIIAPHLSCVYSDCSDDLISHVKGLLQSGTFSPGLPFIVDVPKKQRVRHVGLRRQFANYSRPGGILLPYDRLVLQSLADVAQEVVEPKLDRGICFSHQATGAISGSRMFKSSRECWTEMQGQLAKLGAENPNSIVLKADIAACFQSINQHTLVNNLEYLGYPKELLKPLESMLTQATVSRSSRGVLQGIFPSDLFGNFYLYPIDRNLKGRNIPAVRYVDDIVAFFKTGEECDKYLVELAAELRKLDLSLNEAKTFVTSPVGLLTNDPDLEVLFQKAVAEAQDLLSNEAFVVQSDYGFQAIWEGAEPEPAGAEEPDLDDVAIIATQKLFDQTGTYPDSMEEIERFCLPIFAKFESPYPITHVLGRLETTPSMGQIYYSYLSNFLHIEVVVEKLVQIIVNRRCLFEWEYLWALATVMRMPKANDSLVSSILGLASQVKSEAVRGMCLIVAAKHGDIDRQRSVAEAGQQFTSEYARGAIVFGARYMQKAQRKNVLDVFSNQSPLLKMIAASTKLRSE